MFTAQSPSPGSKGLLILLLFFPLLLFSLAGKVLSADGRPLSQAMITDGSVVAYSAWDGSFSIQTKADSITVSRLGFVSQSLSVRGFRSPVILVSTEIVLPTVRVKALEYRSLLPSLSSSLIHPDTNARVENAVELLLENTSFSSSDIQLAGERQTLSLLGSFSRHSLVILDGVVQNPAGEAFDFSKIPWSQISQIEIIKGNASVFGGSSAIGGIIHLHSKNAVSKSLPELKVSASAGSFAQYKQSYAFAFSRNWYALNAEYSHQTAKNNFEYDTPDYWNVEPVLTRTHNRKTADSFYVKGSIYSSASQLDYSLNAGSFVRQLPGPISFLDLYDSSRLSGAFAQQSLRATATRDRLSGELLLWRNTDNSIYRNLESTNPIAAGHYTQRQANTGLKAGSSFELDLARLALNAECSTVEFSYENHLSGNDIQGKRDNQALAFSAQRSFYPYRFENRFLAAIRGDYSEAELHPTWRLETELKLLQTPQLKLGAYVGTAFSQPSLFDMYWIGDSETQGNPDLKSENSFGYNLFTEFRFSNLNVKLGYYQNQVENLIQWRQYYLNGLSWKPFNVGKAEIRNYEAESSLRIGKHLGLNCSVTHTLAWDKSLNPDGSPCPSYDKKLVYTPELRATARLSLNNEKRGLSIAYHYTGKQYSTPDNLIEPLTAFDNLDLAGFWRLGLPVFSLQLDLKANNLLNKRYSIYTDTPQPGFNWWTGISISTQTR